MWFFLNMHSPIRDLAFNICKMCQLSKLSGIYNNNWVAS